METRRTTLGRYELIRKLASGGMGEVYLGAVRGAAGFEKQVAIKRVLPHLADDAEFVRRFIDEARIVVTLNHGNIVPVLDMGEQDGQYFIAMEYLPGKDLREVLRSKAQGERMPPQVAIYIAVELCRGLGYAHRKMDEEGRALGIVHRDVSPSNVLLSWEGLVKLSDFGVARAVGRLSDSLSGSLRGKLSYMSPEQASGQAIDQRSDIYSVGILLWEMLTGRRLFEAESDTAVLRKVREGAVAPPSSVAPGISPELDALVLKALARDPSARHLRAEELEQELQRHLLAEFDGVGASALSAHLREAFPKEAGSGPGLPSLDDALRAGLPELLPERSEPVTATLSRPPDTVAHGVRRLSMAAVLGLVAGWLALGAAGTPRATLHVDSDPSGATVTLAGMAVGVTPWRGRHLPAGEAVDVEVLSDDRAPWNKSVTLEAHEVRELRAQLGPRTSPADRGDAAGPIATLPLLDASSPPWAAKSRTHGDQVQPIPKRKRRKKREAKAPAKDKDRMGTLSLRIKPWGVVSWKGKRYPSPVKGLEMPAGKQTVRIEHPDWGVSKRVRVNIEAGRETIELVELSKKEGGRP